MTFREVVRLVTPPVFIHLVRRLRTGRKAMVEWEYIPEGWAYAQAHPEVKGWNVQDVLETYQQKWPQFARMVEGTGPLGVTHESTLATNEDLISHNAVMAFAYALALAAHHRDTLSMLDWGGGIGHYCLLAQALLPDVWIEYHCKDVPLLAEEGARLFPDQHFHNGEYCLARAYDLVMASASLHYVEDWRTLVGKLSKATRGYLYITGLPVVQHTPSFVFIQRPYAYGYNTEYLSWCLNRAEFLECAQAAGMRLLREFIVGHRPLIHQVPEQNEYRGFLFCIADG